MKDVKRVPNRVRILSTHGIRKEPTAQTAQADRFGSAQKEQMKSQSLLRVQKFNEDAGERVAQSESRTNQDQSCNSAEIIRSEIEGSSEVNIDSSEVIHGDSEDGNDIADI